MPSVTPAGASTCVKGTRQQQIACFTAKFQSVKGTYQGSTAAVRGKSWAQVYAYIVKQYPKLTPYQAAQAVVGIIAAQRVATGVGATIGGVGTFVNQSGKAAAGAAAKGFGVVPSPGGASAACALQFPGVAGIGGFCIISKTALRALIGGLVVTGAGVLGITAGVVLAAYGLSNTSAGRAITRSAGAVAKVAPFL